MGKSHFMSGKAPGHAPPPDLPNPTTRCIDRKSHCINHPACSQQDPREASAQQQSSINRISQLTLLGACVSRDVLHRTRLHSLVLVIAIDLAEICRA